MHDRKGDGLDFKEYVRFVKSMVDNELWLFLSNILGEYLLLPLIQWAAAWNF